MKQRRAEIGLSQRRAAIRADISPTTWANLENGEAISDVSAAAISRALSWPADAITQLREGADPTTLPTVPEPSERSIDQRLSDFERRFDRIEELLARLEARLTGPGRDDA